MRDVLFALKLLPSLLVSQKTRRTSQKKRGKWKRESILTADEAFPYTMFVFFFKFLGDFRTIFELCTLCSYVCVCAGIFLCGLGLWPHWVIQISCEELYCSRCLYISGTFLSCTHCLHILIWLNLSCVHILFGCRLLCICTGPLALSVFSTCLP